jgi:hypothetical protein
MSNLPEGRPAPQSPPRIPGFTRLSSKIYNLKYSLIDDTSPAAVMIKSLALQSNLDVDYVISYRFAKTSEQLEVSRG